MLNTFSVDKTLLTLLITQGFVKKYINYKYSQTNLNLHNFKILPLNFSYFQILDFSKIKKNIFYIIKHKFLFVKTSIFFLFKNNFYSNTIQKYILDWYERELYEKKTSYCFNIFDKRNLLFNYDFRYSYLQTAFNIYFWAFTNIQSQVINFSNNLRVIL